MAFAVPRIWLGVIFFDASGVVLSDLDVLRPGNCLGGFGGFGGFGIGGFSGWFCTVLIPYKIEQFLCELLTDSRNVAAV
jgi:hypothetical protein